MLWIFLAVIFLGFVLLILGVRGKIVGDEPRCRKCRFDLTGLDTHLPDAVCPECAAKLSDPRAIRSGQRLKRRRCLVLGAALTLLPLGLGVPMLTGHWTSWNKSKPILVLGMDTDYGSEHVRSEALFELRRRDLASMLDTKGARALLHAQAAQIEHAAPLDLSDFPTVQTAARDGVLSETRWARVVEGIDAQVQIYLDQYTLPERWGVVRASDGRLAGGIFEPGSDGLAGPKVLGVLVLFECTSIEIDAEPVSPPPPTSDPEKDSTRFYHVMMDQSRLSSWITTPDLPPEPYESVKESIGHLTTGEYTLKTTWSLKPFVDQKITRRGAASGTLESAVPLTPRTLTTQTRLRISQSSPYLIELVTDADRLKKARLDLELYRIQEYANPYGDPNSMRILPSTSWSGNNTAGVSLVGHLEIEWDGVRIRPQVTVGPEPGPAITIGPAQPLGGTDGFGRILTLDRPATTPETITLIFVPELDIAPDYAGPWIESNDGPMPTIAEELRWENIPVTYLVPEED